MWAHVENDRLKQDDLFRFLSRQRIVVILEHPKDYQREAMRNFLEKPPEGFPELDGIQALPSLEKDETYAIGYITADTKPRPKVSPEFEAYLVTFKEIMPLERFLVVMDTLARTSGFDFALPVFFLPDRMVAPFVQFEVEFLPPELIPGGINRIKEINTASYVKEVKENNNFRTPVILQLEKGAPVNILATILRYQQVTWAVKHAKLWWLRLRMPLEVRAQPTGVTSFGIWEPIRYTLFIERDQDVEILPKAFTKDAVYAWISENTRLPEELIQVDQVEKKTKNLEEGRVLDEVAITFRMSKTGIFILPTYPVQVAYKEFNDQKRLNVFRGSMYTAITIPAQLPKQLTKIPGQLISLREYRQPSWIIPTGTILGVLLVAMGLIGTLKLSRRALGLSLKLEQESISLDLAHKALATKYQDRLKEARRMQESLTFQGNMKEEKEWLHFLIVSLKQLLGDRYYQDESHFSGGLGTSSDSIRRYMRTTSIDPDKDSVPEVLNLLQILEQQVFKKSLPLSRTEAKDIMTRTEKIIKTISELK